MHPPIEMFVYKYKKFSKRQIEIYSYMILFVVNSHLKKFMYQERKKQQQSFSIKKTVNAKSIIFHLIFPSCFCCCYWSWLFVCLFVFSSSSFGLILKKKLINMTRECEMHINSQINNHKERNWGWPLSLFPCFLLLSLFIIYFHFYLPFGFNLSFSCYLILLVFNIVF